MKFVSMKKHPFLIDILTILLFTLIPFVMYGKFIMEGQVLFSGDGANTYMLKGYLNKQLADGIFPMWNRYLEGGVPWSDIYPIGLLLSFLPIDAYSYVFYFVHIILGAFFMYLFLKELNCGSLCALVVSLIYEASVHINGIRKEHISIIIGIIYLPIILYFIQKYINTKKHKWLICSAVVMGFQFLTAHTQTVFYTDVAVFVYLLAFMIKNKMKMKTMMVHMATWFATYFGVIFAQLLGTVSLMTAIAQYGQSQSGYSVDYLNGYSIDFFKLFQMLFPDLFGADLFEAYGYQVSTGIDIEMYLGVFVLFCVIFCAVKFKERFIVKLSLVFMAISFIYAAEAHIPFLSKILVHIPIVGGFRVPSRALFIFIFFAFVLLAVMVNELDKKEIRKEASLFITRFCFGVIGLVVAGLFFAILYGNLIQNNNYANIEIIKNTLKSTFMVCVIILALLWVINRLEKKVCSKVIGIIFTLAILAITLGETWRYSRMTYISDGFYFEKEPGDLIRQLSSENYKVLDATNTLSFNNAIGSNAAPYKGIDCINAYITYNNPYIYGALTRNRSVPMNSTGLMLFFPNIEEILNQKNDLLSILGVKYIIDTSGILAKNPLFYKYSDFMDKLICSDEGCDVTASVTNIYPLEVQMESNTVYRVEFDITYDGLPDWFYFDVYGWDGFDGYNKTIFFPTESEHIVFYYIVEEGCKSSRWGRFISVNLSSSYSLRNIKIYKGEKVDSSLAYEHFYSGEEGEIYTNPNVKDILFVNNYVKNIPDFDEIIDNIEMYDLLSTTYVTDHPDMDCSKANTQISNINFKTNNITADIRSDSDTFINFSQSYWKGWKAYVDGKETTLCIVDGVIMGMPVPAGSHHIEFRFAIPFFYMGIGISIGTIVFWIIYFAVKECYSKKVKGTPNVNR